MMQSADSRRLKPGFRSRAHAAFLAVMVASAYFLPGNPARADADLNLADYDGKVVLLDFWASWCTPCLRSFPWMNEMHNKYNDDGLVIVAVNVDNDLAAAQRFLEEYPPRFQIHFDDDKSIAQEYEIVAMPSSFLIGRDGSVVERHMGFKVLQQDKYEAAIKAALREEQ